MSEVDNVMMTTAPKKKSPTASAVSGKVPEAGQPTTPATETKVSGQGQIGNSGDSTATTVQQATGTSKEGRGTSETAKPATTQPAASAKPVEPMGDQLAARLVSNRVAKPVAGSMSAVGEAAKNGTEYISRADEATAGIDRRIRTYKDVIDRLDAPESEEQRKGRMKRERSSRIIAAVTDGLSALSNLYFTSQYAPNMYEHDKSSQLKARNEALERMREERRRNDEAYTRAALALSDAEAERGRALLALEADLERRRLARAKAERDAEAHEWERYWQPYVVQKKASDALRSGYKANVAAEEAEYANDYYAQRNENERLRGASYSASIASRNRSNRPKHAAWDKYGNVHYFWTEAEADAFAGSEGTLMTGNDVSKSTSEKRLTPDSTPETTTTTKTKTTQRRIIPDAK